MAVEPTLEQRLTRFTELTELVGHAASDDLATLVRIAELNPAVDFRFGDWSGLDARGANLRGYDFTGAVLSDAKFDHALISVGIDANGKPAEATCFDGSVIGQIVKGGMQSAVATMTVFANLTDAADYTAYEVGWACRTGIPFEEAFEVGDIFRDAPFGPALVVLQPGTVNRLPKQSDYVAARAFDVLDELGPQPQAQKLPPWHPDSHKGDKAVYKIAAAMFPTTVAQWRKFEIATGRATVRSSEAETDDAAPITGVSSIEAKAFANWLTDITGKPYRLLSKTEEKHCFAVGGEVLAEHPDVFGIDRLRPTRLEVGRARGNPWKLFDAKQSFGLRVVRDIVQTTRS